MERVKTKIEFLSTKKRSMKPLIMQLEHFKTQLYRSGRFLLNELLVRFMPRICQRRYTVNPTTADLIKQLKEVSW